MERFVVMHLYTHETRIKKSLKTILMFLKNNTCYLIIVSSMVYQIS